MTNNNTKTGSLSLTLGDMEDFENIAGVPFGSLTNLDPSQLNAKSLIALAYVLKRKTNPAVTVEQIRNLSTNDLNDLIVLGVESPE